MIAVIMMLASIMSADHDGQIMIGGEQGSGDVEGTGVAVTAL